MTAQGQEGLQITSKNMTPMTQQQIEDMDEALSDPQILHKIVNMMDLPELKICRKINKSWNSTSTEIMQKRDCCATKFDVDDDDDETPPKTMKEFDELMKKQVGDFPSTSFYFSVYTSCEELNELEKFTRRHGSLIKHLQFNVMGRDGQKGGKKTGEILVNVAPTLEFLDISNFEFTLPQNLVLPSLKEIICRSVTKETAGLIQVLKSCPKLKTIQQTIISEEFVATLQKYGKLSLMEISYWFPGNSPNIMEVVGLNLKKMYLPHPRNQVEKMRLEKLLRGSSEFIQHLILGNGFSDGFLFPKLPNLKILEILSGDKGQHPCDRIFPRGFNFLETFPGLRQIIDSTEATTPPPQSDAINSDEVEGLPTVKILHISSTCKEHRLFQLTRLCPNLTKLEVICFDGKVGILGQVFGMCPNLKEMVMDFRLPAPIFVMDPMMTGMSGETCKRLRSLKSAEVQQKWQDLVTQPSLRDLKRLKMLTIRIYCEMLFRPISRLSEIYAFKMMPDLKVRLLFDHMGPSKWTKALYDEVGSYVNIHHESFDD